MLSVIIPCHNEENYIADCIAAILAQTELPRESGLQIIVAANGCTDRTVDIVTSFIPSLEEKGFTVDILDLRDPGKILAINAAEATARFGTRVYLDADVIISPTLLAEIAALLDQPTPIYASGSIRIPASPSPVTRAYAKVWSSLPFTRDDVPGIGLYALNAPARSRWGAFPDILSDDRFVRLHFSSDERRKTKAVYFWPLPDGFANLVKVRRRWSKGNTELQAKFPELLRNDSVRTNRIRNIGRLMKTPFSGFIFVCVYAAGTLLSQSRTGPSQRWLRGRN